MIRPLKKQDIAVLKKIHEQNGYDFPFPDVGTMEIGFVVEERGRVIGYIGAELQAELFGIFRMDRSPHERMRMFAELHRPVAEQLALRGVKAAFVSVDPQFKRFPHRLMSLGWKESLWKHMFLKVSDCLKLYRKAA